MRISGKQVQRLIVSAVVIGFAAVVAAALMSAWVVSRNQTYTAWVNHTYVVQRNLSLAGALSERAETARRGFLLDPDIRFRDTYRRTTALLPAVFDRLRGLTGDNPDQLRNVARLRAAVGRQVAFENRSFAAADRGGTESGRAAFGIAESAEVMQSVRDLLARMGAEENRLLALRDQEQQSGVQLLYLVLSIAGVLLMLVAAGSLWIILRYMRDLNMSSEALRALNADLEGAVAERTGDLRRANEEIQRFAYIVSHDLRSPLVNVMGFTSELEAATASLTDMLDRAERDAPEVVSEDARLAIREDLPESTGFIRTSTQKMDRLINAILNLSREGRRRIMPEPVDMNALVSAIRDSMQHRIYEIGAELEIDGPLPKVTSDRLALEQILSNLIENAFKYLKPGRPGLVTVSGERTAGRVIYAVADNGRGIAPKDHERIFDLFRRSGMQDQPGEGIGLAHVRALAYRLGGTISCDSALDEGATFRLSLPVTFLPNEDIKA